MESLGRRVRDHNHPVPNPIHWPCVRGEGQVCLYHPAMRDSMSLIVSVPGCRRSAAGGADRWLGLIACLLCCASAARGQQGDVPNQLQPPLPAELVVPAAPALTPEQEAASFELPDGLKIELVAAEPLLNSPVMATFDLDGRLWVVEMSGYMRDADGNGEREPTGAIVILDDDDGDGRMDRRSVFLDGLVLPRSVAPTRGGALVIAPPDVLFCRDTDGDGRADDLQVVDTGLAGLESPEHAPNGLLPTLDNVFACANHGRRYRFEDDAWVLERTAGGGQWGISQDDLGRLFFNTNSDPLRADLVASRYSLRNPLHGAVSGVNVGLAPDRQAWPSRMTTGVNRGYLPDTLRDDWTLREVTAVCAPWVFRGDALRAEDRDSVFVCEPAGNLVQRYQLERDASGALVARNPHTGRDFLTSTDERFRPVNAMGGPDGALYIVDMYRGVLQHKIFMTSWLRAQVEGRALEQPLDGGRIWRVVREEGAKAGAGLPARSDLPALVHALTSPLGWQRDRAQQALVEFAAGQGADAQAATAEQLADQVRSLAEQSEDPLARVHALWTLDGRGALHVDDVRRALADVDLRVRLTALRLAEAYVGAHRDVAGAVALLEASEVDLPELQHQALLSLGASASSTCTKALAAAIRRDASSPERRSAVLSALLGRGASFLDLLLQEPDWSEPVSEPAEGRATFLRLLSRNIGRTRATEGVAAVLSAALRKEAASWQTNALLSGLLDARAPDARGQAGRLPLASRPASWEALLECPATVAAEVAQALVFPGHPTPDERRPVRALQPHEQLAFEQGRKLYAVACASCHQASGRGMIGKAPRLVDSPWVLGEPARLARILLHGLNGPVLVDGRLWNLDMPALAVDDQSLAALLTYVRREWGHGGEPVSADFVSEVRAKTGDRLLPWTVAELEALPAR